MRYELRFESRHSFNHKTTTKTNMIERCQQQPGLVPVEIYQSRVGGQESDVTWFCCVDRQIRLFEKQYPLSEGMSYDSYIIEDEKTVVVDTVDHAVEKSWREKLDAFFTSCGGRCPDFLIVQHLEPDHSAAIEGFMEAYPACKLVCSVKAAAMLGQFASGINADRIVAVKEGDTLTIGSREFHFAMAPMVHWPEVMVTYDPKTRILFSADAFGTFGSELAASVVSGEKDSSCLAEEWPDEARRYFINICGKYGAQVKVLLKKAASLDIRYLCPLHGPVIDLELFNPVDLYDCWASYEAEIPGECLVVAASLHGNTLAAARRFADMMKENGVEARVFDLSETDLSEAVSRAFACGATVFMSSTYDASLVPSMKAFLSRLKSKNWQKRLAGVVENGSWAPIAGKLMKEELAEMKNVTLVGTPVTIRTRLDEASEQGLRVLAEELASEMKKSAAV